MKKHLPLILALTLCLGGCSFSELKEGFKRELSGENAGERIEKYAEEHSSYTQEQVSEKVYAALAAGKKVIEFDGAVSSEMLQQAVYGARYECPEAFWTSGFSMSVNYSSATLECDSIHDLDEQQIAAMYDELNAAADEIVAGAEDQPDDYGKLLFLHDRLIEVCDYDYDSYGSADPEIVGFAGSAYGCLVEHKASCEGYAQAFSLIAKRLGFECGMVCGTAKGDKHAWNYVKADGEYYWLDVTWDENATESDAGFPPMHKYFLLNDELFMTDRTADESAPFVPRCGAMENNFYVRGGMYLDGYSFEEMDALMDAHADEGGLDVMFADRESFDAAKEDLMEQGGIWNTHIMQNGGQPQPYYADPDLRTLTFSWR